MASSSKELELAIKIAGKVESSFTSALGKAGSGIKTLTKTIATATAAAGAAVGAIAVAAVNVGREFEGAMSQVQATMLLDTGTEEGAAAMATLEEAARECGRETAFSATEAAEALNYLALAGYDADKAATALPTVLKLAGAGAMDLASASDMVTDAMSALGLEATEQNLTTFADQLAQTASKSNTSVSQLGEAILTVGGTARYLSGGTTELNTALGLLADNGIKGSEGGTKLRNMIMSLTAPTDNASAALGELGVSVFDAQGNMRDLQSIFGDLNTAMAGMTTEQQASYLSTIFNKTDLKAANALLGTTTERWDELTAAVENSAGACEDMYAIQLDNLNGDIDILKSGLSDLGISIYQDLNGPLRSITQLGTEMVGELSAAYQEGGLSGMVGAVGGCLSEVVDVIASYAPSVVSMGISLIENFVGGIAQNAGKIGDAGGQVITTFLNGLFTLVPNVLLAGIDIILSLTSSITSQLPQLITNGTQAITNFVNGIIQRLPAIISTALTLVQTLVSSISANAPQLLTSAVLLIGNLIMGIAQMLPQLAAMGIQLIVNLANGILTNLPLILQVAVQVVVSLINGLVSMLPQIIQGGIQLIVSLLQGIIQNLPAIIQAAVQIVMALISGLVSAIPQLIAAIPQLIGAIIDTIFTTDWIAVGGDIIAGIADGFMSGFTSLVDSVKGLWSDFTGWLFGDDEDDAAAEAAGSEAATSYANGLAANQAASTDAVGSMIAGSWAATDYTAATAAGTAGANAYTTGLTTGISGFQLDTSGMGLDTSTLTSSLNTAGTESGAALMTSLNSSIGGYTFDASSIGIDTSTLTANMEAAGSAGGEALTTGLTTSMAGLSIDTSALTVDTTGLTTSLTTAGTEGATAISTGLTTGAPEVTAAATTMATDINTALDTGWSSAQSKASAALDSIVSTVTAKAQAAAAAVKAAFENMTITIPKPRIPVISVSTSSVSYGDGGSVSVPQFSVNWNALGGIFDAPAVMNTSQGLQGAGEAGPEALLPLDTLWAQMRSILTDIINRSGGGQGIIDTLIQRLQGIGGGGGGTEGTPQLAGAGGPSINYAPVYNLYGNASTEDAVEAERISQAEFDRMMRQWERDNKRTKF